MKRIWCFFDREICHNMKIFLKSKLITYSWYSIILAYLTYLACTCWLPISETLLHMWSVVYRSWIFPQSTPKTRWSHRLIFGWRHHIERIEFTDFTTHPIDFGLVFFRVFCRNGLSSLVWVDIRGFILLREMGLLIMGLAAAHLYCINYIYLLKIIHL